MSVLLSTGYEKELTFQPRLDLPQDSIDILERIKKMNSRFFSKHDDVLSTKLLNIQPIELTNILNCICSEMIQENYEKDPAKAFQRLADLIPLNSLQKALKPNIEDSLGEAKDMIEAAKYYFEISKDTSPSLKVRLIEVMDGIVSVIESILSAFGIGDFFKPTESEIHSEIKSQRIMVLISLFNMVVGIIALAAIPSAGLYLACAFLAVAALSLIWPLIKPMSNYLPADADNWTRKIQKQGCTAEGRKETLDEIANILKINRHAILVGPSRVGKTITALAFAKAVEKGDYPELKGKKIFRIKTTEIMGESTAPGVFSGGPILKKISQVMGRHFEDYILVLDEIHNACKKNAKAAEQLKTYLDEGGEFSHVIGITTEEEYEKYVKTNTAFSLRFDKVVVQNTSEDETYKILSDTLLKSANKPIISEEDLIYLYEQSTQDTKAPQPITAQRLLKACINRTGKNQQSPTQKKITVVSNKILSLRARAVASGGRKKGLNTKITMLQKKLKKLQDHANLEKTELRNLYKTKALLDKVNKATYESVIKISSIGEAKLTLADEKQLKIFLLMRGFLSRSIENHIKIKSKELGVKLIIDKSLIDEINLK